MNEDEKRIINENIKAIEIRAKYLFRKYAEPNEEFDEFFQTACVFICDRIHKYDNSKGFSTFVDGVLEHAFIDRVRSYSRKRIDSVSLDECINDNEDSADNSILSFISGDNNTEDIVKRCIDNARSKCTARTTVRGFDALELTIAGYTGAQIAKMFNVPSNSLRMWISRAKKKLLSEKEFAEVMENI